MAQNDLLELLLTLSQRKAMKSFIHNMLLLFIL